MAPEPLDQEEEKSGPVDQSTSMESESKRVEQVSSRFAVVFYLAILAIVVLWKPDWRAYVLKWWWVFGPVILLLVVFLSLPFTRRWLEKNPATRRVALLIFVVLPLVVFSIFALVYWLPKYQFLALRIVFLSVVILLPAILYYLFISTRKTSLLNEFITNLDRLGLLNKLKVQAGQLLTQSQDLETLSAQRRFESYLRKFEALYGPVPLESVLPSLGSSERDAARRGIRSGPVAGPRIVSLLTSETPLPVVISTVLMVMGWFLSLPILRGDSSAQNWGGVLSPLEAPVFFSFLGAYFFSLQMLFRRYVRRDLRPTGYVAVSIRIILAFIGTWVVVATARVLSPEIKDRSLLVLGFAIGVFPPVVWQFIQAAFKKITGAGFFLPSLKSQLPISDLDGLTVWHEARLEEEDIENIPNMATADLVELMVQTRLPVDRIVDWIDQAILYMHLGPEDGKNDTSSPRKRLRTHGIRTASSLVEAYRKTRSDEDRVEFERILSAGNGGRSPVRALVDTVATNPNFSLIWTWRKLGRDENRANPG